MLKADGSCNVFAVAAAQEATWGGRGGWGTEREGRETQKSNREQNRETLPATSLSRG